MHLAPWQSTVSNFSNRFITVCAGRRAGKTYLAIRQICYHARKPNQNIYYLTASYRQAKLIAWKLLKEKLLDLRWVKKINESELTILLKNQTLISLKGADNGAQNLRGISLSYCVIDEAALVDPDAWYSVIRPALADQRGGCLFISTPTGKNNWFYELYLMQENNPEWRSFSITTAEAGFVDPEEIEQARSEMSLKQFKQEFEGSWEVAESRICHAFDRDQHIREMPEHLNTGILHVGGDFNLNPITAAIMVKDGDTLYQIDEIAMFDSNTNEIAEELKNRYPNSKIFYYPDPASRQKRTSANGQTDFTILENAGFIVKAPHRHDAVRDRINATNARFASADGVRRLFISKRCKYTIECLEKYNYKEGTQIPHKPGGKHDYSHMFDALSYAVAFIFPLKRDNISTDMEPQRWGVRVRRDYNFRG